MTRALVLSGGSIKGAYQAGVLRSVVETGWLPDLVYGISTGALTGAFVVNNIGAATSGIPTKAQWEAAVQDFVDFYLTVVTGPKVVVKSKDKLSIAWDVLTKDFTGLTDTAPLRKVIRKHLSETNLRNAKVELEVGAVNMASGDIEYASPYNNPNIVDYVYASTAVPIVMPLVKIAGGHYYDGGIRDIAPIGRAINKGADEILCIVCQAPSLKAKTFQAKNVFHLIGRLMDVLTSEIIRNDLREIQRINNVLETKSPALIGSLLHPYKPVKWKLIQPADEIAIDLDDFTPADIKFMIDFGRDLGAREMLKPWNDTSVL